jgi:hypothetical protein
MIPQLKSIFNQNQLTQLINVFIRSVNPLIATKQNLFDYNGSVTGVSPLTIDDRKGGVAEFTNVIARNTSTTLRLDSDQITATSKIIYTLRYSGAGFPQILSHSISSGRVDFRVANTDPTLGSGTATNASLFIEYQIVG